MPFTDPLEPENTETTPLLSSEDRHPSLTRRKKLERIARMLGRVFNPLNDAAIAGVILSTIQTLSSTPGSLKFFPPSLYISVFGAISVSSVAFEIIHSYQLGKHSQFILGESYYEHTKILTQKLTAVLGSEAVSSHHHFERWIMELKQSVNEAPIKNLLRDFEIVNRYNHFRKMIDTMSALILETFLIDSFGNAYLLPDFLFNIIIFAGILIVLGILFSIKICFDRIEHNWFHYENNWKKLPLTRRKSLLAFRTSIEGLYHFGLATFVFGLFLELITGCFLFSISNLRCDAYLLSFWDINFLKSFVLAIPIATTYMLIQLIPERRCCKASNSYHHLKQGTEGILQGAKIASLMSILISLTFINILQKYIISIYYLAIPLISGLVTTVNTILNYQEPDPNMMSTVDHEVSKLREEIVDIKEKLLEEAGHERHGGVNTAMHDKSEIGPDPQDAPLENTQRSTDRSLLSAFCCFWGRSDNHKDTAESPASNHLRETVNFQSV